MVVITRRPYYRGGRKVGFHCINTINTINTVKPHNILAVECKAGKKKPVKPQQFRPMADNILFVE